MGTGSEPRQMPNLRKHAAGWVPLPLFHGRAESLFAEIRGGVAHTATS